jgi:AraC-like DNA-binding protein
MKPILVKINHELESSFLMREDNSTYLYGNLLYHPEIEIMTVLEGSGTRFIGDNIETFEPGEVILLGSNIPHMWRSDEKYFRKDSRLKSKLIVIQFREDFLGPFFFDIPEMKSIKIFLARTKQAFEITGAANEKIRNIMLKMTKETHYRRLMHLLEILNILANSKAKELRSLTSKGFINDYNDTDAYRMGEIYNYALANYAKKIGLDEISSIANMSSNSFCRYFRNKTRTTFTQFLLEIRVGRACKMLIEDSFTVAQICFKSGFENLSNFNRQFKKITKLTPMEYRRKFLQPKS